MMKLFLILVASCHIIQAHSDHDHHGHDEDSTWTHYANLTKMVGVDFKWDASHSDYILMQMSSKTKGYVSVGFCPEWHGSMKDCDIVIGWVANGQGHLHDYHALADATPIKDESQDYVLTSAKEDDWLTTITFKRNWTTGDDKDADLANSKVQLIWSWNPEDVIDGLIKPHDKNTRGHTREMISLKSPPPVNRVSSSDLIRVTPYWVFLPALTFLLMQN